MVGNFKVRPFSVTMRAICTGAPPVWWACTMLSGLQSHLIRQVEQVLLLFDPLPDLLQGFRVNCLDLDGLFQKKSVWVELGHNSNKVLITPIFRLRIFFTPENLLLFYVKEPVRGIGLDARGESISLFFYADKPFH